jgi:IS605 OrfB family transposase
MVGDVLRKCILLNTLKLTSNKQRIFNGIFSEYLRVLNETLKSLPNAGSSTELHHLTYLNVRKTSFLPSDIVQEARKDVWAKRKTVKEGFRWCSIRLNQRWFRYVKSKRGNPCFKVTYAPGKSFVVPIKIDGQLERFNRFLCNGWTFRNISLLRGGRIVVVLEKKFPAPENARRFVVGVDVGSTTLAAVTVYDSKNGRVAKQLYLGRDVARKQRQFQERRSRLQAHADRGSRKARKYLKKLRHKQRNYVKTRSGQVAKEVVALAHRYGASVAIEKLGFRSRKHEKNRKANQKINRIPYARLKEFLASDCEQSGVLLHKVDAYHTSKWCNHCGAVNPGHYSKNYALYKCKCGLVVNSDRKASLVVAVKSALERAAQDVTNPRFAQFSSARVPVNGLVRPDAAKQGSAVRATGRPMESSSL